MNNTITFNNKFFFRTILIFLFFFLVSNAFAQTPPVAGNDNAGDIDEDTQLSPFNISNNDTDTEDGVPDPTTIVLIDPDNPGNTGNSSLPLVIPDVGEYTIDVSGNLTFEPVQDYNGSADVNYTIQDSDGEVSNVATVTITVTSINDDPVAVDDTGNSTNEDTQLSVGDISANDTDVDGTVDPSSIVLIDPNDGGNTGETGNPLEIPGVGTYTVDASGNLTFDPEENYYGDANVNYTIEDDLDAVSNEATVFITVTSVNDAPVAVNNPGNSTNEDTQLSVGDISANDMDVDGTVDPSSIVLIDPNDGGNTGETGNPLEIPGEGTYTIDASGNLTFNPAENYSGGANIRYTIADDQNAISNEATVFITVIPVNDAPVAVNDNGGTTDEDIQLIVNDISSNDSDVDGTVDPSTIILIDPSDGGNTGETGNPLEIAGVGTYTIDALGNLTYDPAENYGGSANIYYTIEDNVGAVSNQATISITVNAVNDAPISVRDEYLVNEGGTRTISATGGLLENDSDPDGDNLEVVVSLVTQPIHGTVDVDEDGSFVYEHDGSETTLDSFTYVATDGVRDGNRATVRFTIEPVNDPPYFQYFSQINNIYEGSDTTFTILSDYAIDEESEDSILTFSIGLPRPSNVNAYINEDTLFIAPIDENWFGSEEIYLNINDNDPVIPRITRDTILINVTNIDDAPQFIVDTIHVTPSNEDASVTDVVINLNTDVVELDGDELILQQISPQDPIFSFSLSLSGSEYTIASTIPQDWNGERYIKFCVIDNNTVQRMRDTIVLHYIINPVDDPPFVDNPIEDLVVDEDANNVVYDLYDVFGDIDNTDEEMVFSLIDNSNENIVDASITETGELVLRFLEDKNTSGSYGSIPEIEIGCTSNGKSIVDKFRITVNPVNDPPTFSISGDVIIIGNQQDQQRIVTVFPDDVPDDECKLTCTSYSLYPLSVDFATVSISANQGHVTINVEAGAEGTQDFRIRATDTEDIAEQWFTLSINKKGNPNITFEQISNKTLADSIVLLEATTSSDAPISFSIVSGLASVSNDTLFILGAGEIKVKASCEATALYNSGEEEMTFYVEKLPQEITFDELPDRTYGDDNFTLDATSSSGLSVSYDVEYGPVDLIHGNEIRINGTGYAKIVAYQNGDASYSEADTVSHVFEIYEADQFIQFNALTSQTYTSSPIPLSATSSSGLPVSFEVVSGSANVQGSSLYLTGSGYITVRAFQNGNTNYNPAEGVEQIIEIYKATQSITFKSISDTTYGSYEIDLDASTSSGLIPQFIIQGPVEVNDTTLSIIGTGNVYVSAFHPGDDRYLPTDTITRSFEIEKSEQYIELDQPPTKVYNMDGVEILATASSGLEPRFEVISGPATAEGNVIEPYDYGEVEFRVLQDGDENYKPTALDYTITFVEAQYDISIGLLFPTTIDDIVIERPVVIEVRIKNVGNRDFDSFNVAYIINNDDNNNTFVSEYYPSIFYTDDSIDYSFSTIWSPKEKNNEVCVFLQSENDDNPTNDTVCLPLSTSAVPLSYNDGLIENVYPNPANDFVYFSMGKNVRDGKLIIYNLAGAVVEQFDINSDANKLIFEVDVNRYMQGTYYYRYINNQEYTTGKFVVY